MAIYYKVEPSDINLVRALGFDIKAVNLVPEDFINSNFPNFNLLKFVQQTELWLKPLAQDLLVKNVLFQKQPSLKLVVEYYSKNYLDEDKRLLFKRTFIKSGDEIIVYHDFLVLPMIFRGQRIGRKVLAFCLQHYLSIDVKRIIVHAALENGSLEWAKAGFRATEKQEVYTILQDAEKQLKPVQFKIVKVLFDNYYDADILGNAFPIREWAGLPFMKEILKRHHWHGEINLKNAKDLFNFNNYVTG